MKFSLKPKATAFASPVKPTVAANTSRSYFLVAMLIALLSTALPLTSIAQQGKISGTITTEAGALCPLRAINDHIS